MLEGLKHDYVGSKSGQIAFAQVSDKIQINLEMLNSCQMDSR